MFTAKLLEELYTESSIDKTAKAIATILKYRGGVPFYQQEQILNEILDSRDGTLPVPIQSCLIIILLHCKRIRKKSHE